MHHIYIGNKVKKCNVLNDKIFLPLCLYKYDVANKCITVIKRLP
jgi:hypothetical protein